MSHSAAPSGPSSVDMIEVVDLDSPAAAAAAATLGEDDVIAVTGSSVPSSSWPPVAAGGGGGGGMQLNGTAVLSESVSWRPSQQGTIIQLSLSILPSLLSSPSVFLPFWHFSVFLQRPIYGVDNCVVFLRNISTYVDTIPVQHPDGARPFVLEILLPGHCKPKTGSDH